MKKRKESKVKNMTVDELAVIMLRNFEKMSTKNELKQTIDDAVRSVMVAQELTRAEILGVFKDQDLAHLKRHSKINEKVDQNYVELNKRLKVVEKKVSVASI